MKFGWCKTNLNICCKEYKYDHCEMCNIIKAYQHGYETAQEDMSKTGWIPCSERLPSEKDGQVLVTKHGEVRIATYSEFSGTWYIGEMCAVSGEDPIAWMPLPKPYRDVVRCKDCKWWQDNLGCYSVSYCPWNEDIGLPDADDFCSYGERIK